MTPRGKGKRAPSNKGGRKEEEQGSRFSQELLSFFCFLKIPCILLKVILIYLLFASPEKGHDTHTHSHIHTNKTMREGACVARTVRHIWNPRFALSPRSTGPLGSPLLLVPVSGKGLGGHPGKGKGRRAEVPLYITQSYVFSLYTSTKKPLVSLSVSFSLVCCCSHAHTRAHSRLYDCDGRGGGSGPRGGTPAA